MRFETLLHDCLQPNGIYFPMGSYTLIGQMNIKKKVKIGWQEICFSALD
jgi:hypothetical protein